MHMADHKSLGMIGFILAGVTAAVMLAGVMVVQAHIDGRLELDQARPVLAALPTVVR
jgi:hypothetical protein